MQLRFYVGVGERVCDLYTFVSLMNSGAIFLKQFKKVFFFFLSFFARFQKIKKGKRRKKRGERGTDEREERKWRLRGKGERKAWPLSCE